MDTEVWTSDRGQGWRDKSDSLTHRCYLEPWEQMKLEQLPNIFHTMVPLE